MPRYLTLSNGRLLVNFDREYRLRDLYWPHVGQENHTEGDPFGFGVRWEDQFSWTGDPQWEKEICYLDDALVSETTLRSRDLGLALVCREAMVPSPAFHYSNIPSFRHSTIPQPPVAKECVP